jgi:hypothetical protein
MYENKWIFWFSSYLFNYENFDKFFMYIIYNKIL